MGLSRVEPLEERKLLSLAGNQLFPSDNPWNHPITEAPVAANSATLVSSIGPTKPLHPDFGTTYDGTLNGIPYNVAPGSQPKVNVTIDAYPDESDLEPVPIPANAVIEGDAPGGVADYQQLPSSANVSLSGQSQYTWNTSTNDARAVQDPLNPSNRVASTWESATKFTLDLNITDGSAHRIGLYLLDWDSQGRSESVSVLNPANGQVLATQSASNLSGGTWLVFDVSGHVQLQFTTTAGPNAVLSGLFFGAPGTPSLPAGTSPAASFVRTDMTTQGSWQGVYGADGYSLPTVNAEGDRHLIVYDQTNNISYELFNAHRPSEEPDGQWHADSEAVWNMSLDSFRTPGYTSADAAGLPVLPGLVRPDEVLTQGAITHALRFTVPKTDAAYVFPASHEAGVNNPALPRMGERFRLNPNFDVSGFPAADQVILQALKTYGMIVADNGSAWYLSGAPSDQWNDTTLHALTSVLGSNFQAVDLTPVVSSLTQASGSTAGGTTVTVHGVNFTGVAGKLSVSFGGTPATNVVVIDDNTLTAVAPAHAVGAVDVTLSTPYGTSAMGRADQFTYIPPWLAANSQATWDASTHTLTVTGSAAIIADPGSDEPSIVESGSAAQLKIQPATSPTDVHVGSVSLSSGASLQMVSLGSARTHNNHNVLVVGTLGAASNPTFAIDSTSKLDLSDNDLILHVGSSDANGTAGYATVSAAAKSGRGGSAGAPDGTWAGFGLDSSAANSADNKAGYEQIGLAVVVNNQLINGTLSKWTVGSASENLAAGDVIVKYDYLGDYALEGYVGTDDAAILQGEYDNGTDSTHSWATGASTFDGLCDTNEAAIFQGQYGLGTGGNEGAQL